MLKYEKLLWGTDSMQDENTKRLLELQMEELKSTYSLEKDETCTENTQDDKDAELAKKNKNEKNAKLAKLYEDAAEYEEELESFQNELEIINSNELKDIADALTQNLPDEDRDYSQELKTVLLAGWTQLVEVDKTQPIEQLELIKETEFCDVLEKLTMSYPDHKDAFEEAIRKILLTRWETLIAIKKEHIEEEMEEIYIAGLKPSFVKRIYKQYHNIK